MNHSRRRICAGSRRPHRSHREDRISQVCACRSRRNGSGAGSGRLAALMLAATPDRNLAIAPRITAQRLKGLAWPVRSWCRPTPSCVRSSCTCSLACAAVPAVVAVRRWHRPAGNACQLRIRQEFHDQCEPERTPKCRRLRPACMTALPRLAGREVTVIGR